MNSEFKPTDEQENIARAVKDTTASVMVEADAGASKTTTMVLAIRRLPPIPLLLLAFNKKTAEELKGKMPPYATVKTMNGLGYSAWARRLGGRKLELDDAKVWKIIRELERETNERLLDDERQAIKGMVDTARQEGLVPKNYQDEGYETLIPDTEDGWGSLCDEAEPSRELIGYAKEALRRSIKQAEQGVVDFDDMIYCSVMLGGQYQQFPFVAVDESQDLNALNHRQVAKSLKPEPVGRLFIVGDRKQSIYGFRGTHRFSMDELKKLRSKWIELPLHKTFRCPKKIVARQQSHAPGYEAAEHNEEGEIYEWTARNDKDRIEFGVASGDSWDMDWVKSLKRPGDRVYMLCRNNAPIMSVAFALLRQRITPEVLGREIGKGLEALTRKIAGKAQGALERPIEEFLRKLDEWESTEVTKAELMMKEQLIEGVRDRAQCLRVLSETALSPKDLLREIEHIFAAKKGEVVLSTIHKAKGLEAEIIVHLDPWRIPSKWACKQAALGNTAELEQENNLRYVCETRTRRVYIEANSEDFRREE